MIFVTVGTAHYDPLIQKMDELIHKKKLTEPVIAQIGRGNYIPQHMRYFRFIRNLKRAYSQASVIVSTGGAGTTMECVTQGLKLVVVENATLAEGHQAQLIGEMERRGHLIWCRNLDDLPECIAKALSTSFTPFVSDPPRVHEYILSLLEE